ncbi:hypothetical protein J4H86_24525 [Spiractinospora alimapuensis]|uniref:hypothetical protein n=1 Tax=Spiractinospora alimapuensis TaxID=2820884 RepID=UPI001F2B3608|nr:hypothetical protein [Spiractinospora alimapuensis]QVQ51884.1 hypothetical protein J4H86_24525 [Spiractinospora alimapuensis]
MSYPGPPDPYGDPYNADQPAYGADPANPFGTGPQPGDPGYGQIEPYNPQSGGWQALPPGGGVPAQPSGAPIAQLGDITITQNEVITPSATFPLAGSQWTINDMTQYHQKLPSWALAVALIGFFFVCVFSLFFLLAKETTVQGGIQVTVRSNEHYHVTMIPIHNAAQVQQVHTQFAYIRSMAGS